MSLALFRGNAAQPAADPEAKSAEELAKETQNPVANLFYDINPSLFLSPANAGKLIWGLGPTLTFPTASASVLGNGKWEAGPAS